MRPPLIPTPRRLEITGPELSVPGDAADYLLDPKATAPRPSWLEMHLQGPSPSPGSIDAQAYRLRIRADESGAFRATLTAAATEGIRHARTTLAQLVRFSPRTLPAMEIEDSPAIRTRGVMLDVSRCRIPTMDEFGRIIGQLAHLKCNHLQLYTEHTFAYAGHEEVWRDWSPLTLVEIRTLDRMCLERGIELAANQNCFGHLRHWLEHPKYAHLAETHGDWLFDVWPRSGPFSLCPTDPASLRFVEDLLGQLLPNFSGGLVNIGCDETYDIAYGRSRDEVSRRGRGVVFAQFVSRIADVARRRRKRPMFWGDIALSQPECLGLLPRDLIALAWGYEPDAPFDRWCDLLGEAGLETWLCPGTSSWRSITGRTTERRANIDAAVKAAVRHRAPGVLICDWGDSGHWQQWPVSLHGIANGLAAAWQGDSSIDLAAESLHLFGDRTNTVAPWLERFGDLDFPLREVCGPLSRADRVRLPNQSAIFADWFKGWDEQREIGPLPLWRAVHSVAAEFRDASPSAGNDPRVWAELSLAARMAYEAAARGWLRREKPGDKLLAWGLSQTLEGLEAEHRTLWPMRSRPGGLDQSCAFFDQIRFE